MGGATRAVDALAKCPHSAGAGEIPALQNNVLNSFDLFRTRIVSIIYIQNPT